MLNIPDKIYNKNTFFDDFNSEFLDYLIENKSKIEIIFTTNPNLPQLLIRNIDFKPTGFAMEIRYLREKGVKKVKFKDGSVLNLDEIDLFNIGIDWSDWRY